MADYPGALAAPPPMDFRGAPEPGMAPDIPALRDLAGPGMGGPGGDPVSLLRQAAELVLQAAQAFGAAGQHDLVQGLADVMSQIERYAMQAAPTGMPGPPGGPGMGPEGGPPLPLPMRPPMLNSPAGMAPMGLPLGPRS